MRAPIASVTAAAIVIAVGCAPKDEGNLVIRCPSSDGAMAVNGGEVTIGGVAMHVAADLTGAPSADEGMTFVIDVELPDSPAHAAPSVDCVRVEKTSQNARWDARPSTVHESFNGSTAHIQANGDHGPHWVSGDGVDVTVWLTVAERRYPLTLGHQQIQQ